MFVVNNELNRITKIQDRTFSELGFRERANLQEWLEHYPEAFGEDLLFIQKEFDGFDDTRERIDLVAIDKQGNLVVIENKLDDSGRDVTWQVLKYASYCSSLSKQQIKDIYQQYLDKSGKKESSEQNIVEFLEAEDFAEVQLNKSQRIILVAGNYRKEVTSTVIWLLTKYNMKIQCFKATPYLFNNQTLVDIQQIIPVKEVEEYTIRMAEKALEEQSSQDELKARHKVRLEFWRQLLPIANRESQLFANVSPSKDNWISAGAGIGGVTFAFVVAGSYARTELYIARSAPEENKFIFDKLLERRQEIEAVSGQLEWERLDGRRACRIKRELGAVNLYDKDDWAKMNRFLAENMRKMEQAFQGPLKVVNAELKKQRQRESAPKMLNE